MTTRFLPAPWRVALTTLRGDVRSVARALTEPRFRGSRDRSAAVHAARSRTAPVAESRPVAEPRTISDAVLVFRDSGVELAVRPGETILEAGLRDGVDLLFSCTLGGCGACMLQIVEGEVEYEDPDAICLTDDEIADGLCLACVGRPRGRLVLEA